MAFCKTNGVTIHYNRTGGNRPALVLLHGLAANGACWTGFMHYLDNELDIIMPDARGHGKSSATEYGYTYNDHANDIIGLINSLGLSHVFLLGHSMGGMTATLIASYKPGFLRGLVLTDPTFLSTKDQRQIDENEVKDQHRLFLSKSLTELVADLQNKHPNRSSETIRLIAQARLQTSIEAFDILKSQIPDYKQLVSSIDIPSLLIYGDKGVIRSAVCEEIRCLNQKFEFHKILNVGHGLHYDQPELIATEVMTFIRSIENNHC